jgi:hypothetical protein
MTFYNQSDEYFKGFIVGALTIMTVMLPTMIAVSIINLLPDLYKVIGLVAFALSLPFWIGRAIIKVEKLIRTRFERANPKVNNTSVSNKGSSNGEKQ